MGILEEELKKRFSDNSATGGVEAEGLWDAVSESLDASDKTRPAGYFGWARMAGLALLVGSVGFYFYTSDENFGPTQSTSNTVAQDLSADDAERKNYSTIDRQENEATVALAAENKLELERAEQIAFNGKKASDDEIQKAFEAHDVLSNYRSEIAQESRSTTNTDATLAELSDAKSEAVKSEVSAREIDTVDKQNSIESSSDTGESATHVATSEQDRAQFESEAGEAVIAGIVIEKTSTNVPSRDELQVEIAANGSGQVAEEISTNLPSSDERQVGTAAVGSEQEEMGSSLQFLTPLSIDNIAADRSAALGLQDATYAPEVSGENSRYVSKRNFAPNELGFGMGVDLLKLDYQESDSSPNLNDLSADIPGYSTSLVASWISDKGLRVSLGLEYAKLRSKFEFSAESAVLYLDEDRLITYELDDFTGDTINAVYQDTWLDAIETRTIVHHNEFDLLSIPISIGYERDFGKIGLGIDAGLSYGFFLNQKGRSIDAEGAVAEFDMNKDDNTPFKSSLLSYSLSPIVDYRLSDVLSIRLAPQVRFSPKTDSDFHGISQSAMILRLSGGIVYQLK